MPMDEVIRAIEQTDIENMQDLLQATMKRYRELYPQWEIMFISADTQATDTHSKLKLALISYVQERLLGK